MPVLSGPKDLRYFDRGFTELNPTDTMPPEKGLNPKNVGSNAYIGFTYQKEDGVIK